MLRPINLPKKIPAKWWTWFKLPGRHHVRKPAAFWAWRKWRLSGARLRPNLYKRAVALAAKQLGTKESPAGSNHQKYGVWYGLDRQPWCAIFVSWVLSHVGHPFKYSYVPAIVADARSGRNGLKAIPYKYVRAHLEAGVPVLACYDWGHDGTADHVGFVEKVVNSSTFVALEGNTSHAGSQSNGGEVCRQTRYTSEVQAFVAVK